jgi:hypothetical protein
MSIFHKHQWKEVTRTYSPPHELPAINAQGGVIELWMRQLEFAANGITSILWKCESCQEFRTDELLGKEIQNEKL